jgi:HEAT repeat protein
LVRIEVGILPKLVSKLFLVMLLLLASVCACAQSAPASSSDNQPRLTRAQQLELQLLGGQLSDSQRTDKTKLEAAELLLTRDYPQAVQMLQGFLADSKNPAARIAVAEAVARGGGGAPSFIDPLMEMLLTGEAEARLAASRALATYKNFGVMERLVAVARDSERERAVRLATISTLTVMLDKQAVDALVGLLDDEDSAIGQAAAEALAKMTSIRAFGNDTAQWRSWWARNRNKPQREWLSDLADSLARSKVALENENARLRGRMAQAMSDLYDATAASQREDLLQRLLKDALPDVRLVGAELLLRRVSAGDEASEPARVQVRVLLADDDPRIRRVAALLVASQSDAAALPQLLDRLQTEEAAAVREALVTALGQLREPEAVSAVLAEVQNASPTVAAAAAAALARQVERGALGRELAPAAIEALLNRFDRINSNSAADSALRESLLTAMGRVGDPALLRAIEAGLKSPAATVRLAAVKSLARCGNGKSVSLLEPLMRDADRGVRQAAIAGFGTLGGEEGLKAVLARTNPDSEPDATVRQQAWDVVMSLLSNTSVDSLGETIDSLEGRADAASQRLRMMQLLVERMAQAGSDDYAQAARKLGLALLKVGRPAEGEVQLARAYAALVEAESEDAPTVWLEWVGALLAADDARAVTLAAAQTDADSYAKAMAALKARLDERVEAKAWPAVIRLTQAALKELDERLSDEQRRQFAQRLQQARDAQLHADRQRVAQLLPAVANGDEAARNSALAQIQTLGERAIGPLVMELRGCLKADPVDQATEKAIVSTLTLVAPTFQGYDASAEKAARLKLLEDWLAKE